MRIAPLLFAALFACAPSARAEEDPAAAPLLDVRGSSLHDFRVVADLVQVDHATAEGLARSFARLQTGQARVAQRFSEAFEEAHLAVLARYYADDLVARQRAEYAEVRARRGVELTTRVEDLHAPAEGVAKALLVRRFLDPVADRENERRVRVEMERRNGLWWVTRVLDEVDDDGETAWAVRPWTLPPARARNLPIAPPVRADRSTPGSTIVALRDSMRRLARLRLRAQGELSRSLVAVLGAFFGEARAKRAVAERPDVDPVGRLRVEVEANREQAGRRRRVAATVLEPVPGEEGIESPVGQAFFDLEPAEGGWRVVGELVRPAPDELPRPSDHAFALLLAVP